MNYLALYLLLILGGYLLRCWHGGRWKWVPGKPRLNQDARHFWIATNGRTFAFTGEALEAAERRAYNLTNPRHVQMRWLAWTAAIAALVLVMLLGGCGKREDLRPAPTSSITKDQAILDASAWALRDPSNRSFSTVADTGSMVPLFDSRAVLLLEPAQGPDLVPGDIALYDNLRGSTICHRVREVSGTAVLFTGDNNDKLSPDGWIAHERIRWRVAGMIYSKR